MHSNRISIIIGLTVIAISILLLSVYVSTQGKLTLDFSSALYRYVRIASRHWWRNREKTYMKADAGVWYQWDFEQGKGDWTLGSGTALSSKHSRSGTYSVVSNAKGENGKYAEILLDMIPRDARTVVDAIWVYHDGKNTSSKAGGTHHISSWASSPGTGNWSGPHVVTSVDNEIGFYPYDTVNSWSGMKLKPNVWYRIKVVIDVNSGNFDVYVLEDGRPEADEIRVIEKGVFAGTGRFPMFPHRRFGAWLSPGAEAYFDDYSIGYEVRL